MNKLKTNLEKNLNYNIIKNEKNILQNFDFSKLFGLVPYDYNYRTNMAFVRKIPNLALIENILIEKGWIVFSGYHNANKLYELDMVFRTSVDYEKVKFGK